MKKDMFEEIEVPTFEAKHALSNGIKKGVQKEKMKKNRTRNKMFKIMAPIAAAAALTFSLGFVSEPIAKAVSSIPVVGDTLGAFYESYAINHGGADALPDSEQIEETSMVQVDQGITVEITGAYNYQNGIIGIFFEAYGDIQDREVFGENTPVNGYNYYIYDHTTDQERAAFEVRYDQSGVALEKVDDKYVGNIEITFEDEEYVENLDTIPLTFSFMCGKEGEWSFEIPVVDDPNTIVLDEVQNEHEVTIEYDSIYSDETTSSLYYSVTGDITYENNDDLILYGKTDIQFTFVDDKGEEIPVDSINVPKGRTVTDDTICTYYGEVTFSSPIPADCESITVNIEFDSESGEKVTLTPFVLEIK